MSMLWIDVETTDLDPDTSDLLEVGLVHTDRHLSIKGEIHVSLLHLNLAMDPTVRSIHTENGLIDECKASLLTVDRAEDLLLSWLSHHVDCSTSLVLSDNVEFDLSVIAEKMPRLRSSFSHRHIDVSHIRRLARLWYGYDPRARLEEKKHRTSHCIRLMIDELDEYRSVLFRTPVTESGE